MKKMNKKGFTIVELVIVIAVIAIMSAVLIPTFSGIIKKSRESSDQSAVRNMNQILAGEVDNIDDINDVFALLSENGINAEDYTPLYKGRLFFWDPASKMIVYTDENYNVLYPADQVGATNQTAFRSLSGKLTTDKEADKIVKDVVKDINNGAVAADNTKELVTLVQAIKAKESAVSAVTTIDLKANTTYNVMGAEVNFGELTKTVAVNGNGATLDGVVNNEAARDQKSSNGADRSYAAGLVNSVKNGANVTISNITLSNTTIGDKAASLVGLVGAVYGTSKVTFDNVKMENVTIVGLQKVGAYVGYVNTATNATITENVVIKSNCTATNVAVQATQGMAGGIFGLLAGTNATNAAKVTVEDLSKLDITTTLVKASTGDYRTLANGDTIAMDMNNDLTVNTQKFTDAGVKDANGTAYRYFATCAKYGFVYNGAHTLVEGLKGYQGLNVVMAYGATAVTVDANATNVTWTDLK